MISDEHLFDSLISEAERVLQRELDLLTTVIERCCAIKAGVVSRDERETSERAILNYGHTVGHALETATGYGTMTHGEAISVGMAAACRIGVAAGVTPAAVEERQAQLLAGLNLPRSAPGAASPGAVARLIGHDKKEPAWGAPAGCCSRPLAAPQWGHRVLPETVSKAALPLSSLEPA